MLSVKTPKDPITLVVGDMESWQSNGRTLPELAGLTFVDVENLTIDILRQTGAEIVMSSLFVRNFDAVEIARQLQDIGFRGLYRVVVDTLPNAALVQTDIKNAAPELDFAIVSMDEVFPS